MTNRWEKFAQEDAEYFIWTDLDRKGGPEAIEAFFESGRRAAQRLLDFAGEGLSGHDRSLEIGCGVGRLTLAMAERFGEARGVDIAPTMLRKLNDNAAARERPNVRGYLTTENWDEAESVDFAYSWLVFQHIEDFSIIESYLRRIARTLKPSGVACLQFDTRPRGLAYRVRFALPAFLLPRNWRHGIRRIRRDPDQLRVAFARSGLRIEAEQAADSDVHLFRLRRLESAPQ